MSPFAQSSSISDDDVLSKLVIRREKRKDITHVTDVHNLAFSSNPRVVSLVADLRQRRSTVSLVATIDNFVVGNVVLSDSCLDASPRLVDVRVLSPLAVRPQFQGRGVARALIQHALAAATRHGSPLVWLEGNPGFYERFGFVGAASLGFRSPSSRIPTGALQVVLLPEYRSWMTGTLVYSDAFWGNDCVGLRDGDA